MNTKQSIDHKYFLQVASSNQKNLTLLYFENGTMHEYELTYLKFNGSEKTYKYKVLSDGTVEVYDYSDHDPDSFGVTTMQVFHRSLIYGNYTYKLVLNADNYFKY